MNIRNITIITIFVLSLFLYGTIVSAVSFEAEITPIKDRIFQEETASFKITIKNRERYNVRFDISSIETIAGRWLIITDPITDRRFVLEAGDTKEVELNVRPLGGSTYGGYTVPINIKGTNMVTGDITDIENKMNVVVLNPEGYIATYSPRIVVQNPVYPDSIVPGTPFKLELTFHNRNGLNISKANIKIYSSFFSQEIVESFEPYQKKTLSFNINPGEFAEEGSNTLSAEIVVGNEVVTQQEFNMNAARKEGGFVSAGERVDKYFLKKEVTYSVRNNANFAQENEFRVPVWFLGRIYTSTRPADVEYNKGAYVYKANLGPGETAEFTVIYNHRTTTIIIIILLVLFFIYRRYRPDVFVSREVVSVKLDDDNSILGSKIAVHLKNITGSALQNVVLNEHIPSVATYHQGDSIIPPSKVKENEHGTDIVYTIPEIGAKEEIVITYHVRAKTKLQELTLKESVVEYIKGTKDKLIYGSDLKVVGQK